MSGFPSQSAQNSQTAFSFASSSTSPPLAHRKRRAASPPSPLYPIASPTTAQRSQIHSSDSPGPHAEKRRRPNLANGFSGLTLDSRPDTRDTSPLPSYEDSEAAHRFVDEDEDVLRTSLDREDLRVEELPNRPSGSRSFPSRGDSTSSASTTPTDEEYDSDATFRLPGTRSRRHAGVAQQADQIEQPDSDIFESTSLGVEDITNQPSIRGRKRREEDEESRAEWKRQRRDMDVDIEMGDLEEMPQVDRRRRKTEWHEPEKDRIVITSLGSPSSSRSSSSDRSSRHLTQPGSQGFTLSPTFLTHLLAAQREQQLTAPGISKREEQGLVLWRPPGLPPGWSEQVVRPWEGTPSPKDEARFQEVDDMDAMELNEDVMDEEEDMGMEIE